MRGGLYYARGDKEPFTGKQITPHSDGSKWLEMPYVNGKRHGKKIWYEIDGRIGYETPYVDGRRQGVAITYYEDGSKKAETPWVKGNRNGTKIKYRQDGSKESETVYLNNNKQSGIWYREDGSKWKEMRYDKDQHNGVPTYYDENGIKKEEPPMVDGKLHGMVVGYHRRFFLLDSVFIVISRYTVMLIFIVAHFLPLRSIFSVPNLRLFLMFYVYVNGFPLFRSVLTILNSSAISIAVYIEGF
jgi:antitoxin component YwqK of YwqJK toxin-antitoxin module